ncbi:hypothetical protein [Hymenobacter cellulosilyticus]|uniref:Uncharacterized protein n=1 Tax=Hymenobacter cellulosilyticus TaxID=2932248 RepID=A0A8T9Q3Q4_9BACT|nr:hypothetical protein [Hymenobacter cellulosilyticus]UOQ71685.1 hypothetical protein MUN79_24255 [Hymenobacter cellulosilyticus]
MNSVPRFETTVAPPDSSQTYVALILAALGLLCCRMGGLASAAHILFLLMGSVLVLVGLGLGLSSFHFVLDKTGNRYRSCPTLLGFNLGDWQPLPSLSGITVKYFSEYPIAGRRRWQTNNPQEHYIVMLSSKAANRRGIVVGKFPYRQKSQATDLAAQLAAYLALPVTLYDAPE